MAVASVRRVIITFTGDITAEALFSATNAASPGNREVTTLALGANTISVPSGATGVTIILPSNNTTAVTLKGVSGDSGIALNLTGVTSLGLGSGVSSFVLTAAAQILSVQLIWS